MRSTAWRPDLLLLIADRYEMLAPAAVALALRIPIAHIEGGEVSQGAIDDQVRNALTKLAHIHFTSTETARRRVIAMGEEPWRVHRAGAPSLDHLRRSTLLDRTALEARLGIALTPPTLIAAWHPVTILRDTNAEADAFFRRAGAGSGADSLRLSQRRRRQPRADRAHPGAGGDARRTRTSSSTSMPSLTGACWARPMRWSATLPAASWKRLRLRCRW